MKITCKLCKIQFDSEKNDTPGSIIGNACFAHLIMDHPEIKDQLLKEIREIFSNYFEGI